MLLLVLSLFASSQKVLIYSLYYLPLAEDVKLFLLKQTYKSFLFISETMDVCRAGNVQQAQQSTHLTEGLL